MAILVWNPQSQSHNSPQWLYDVKRSRLHYQETTEESEKRVQKEKKAKALKEERKRWEEMRRRAKQFEEKKLLEKTDIDKRCYAIKTRVEHLRKQVASNHDDDAARAELAYARAQLFWEGNTS